MLERLIRLTRLIAPANSPWRVATAGVLGVLLVGYIDWVTSPEIALSIIYLIPISACAWRSGWGPGAVVSCMAAVVWTFLDMTHGRPYQNQFAPYWNGLVRLFIFLLVTGLFARIRMLTIGLHELVAVRTAALQKEIDNRKELERLVTQISAREQQRLAGELHDQLAGQLAGTAFLAKALSESLSRRDLPEAPEARKLVGFVNNAHRQLRGLCRLLAPVDAASGLDAGLSRLGAEIESTFGVTCIVQTPKDAPELPLDRARLLYNIAQETVRRAIEQRGAKQIEISLFHDTSDLKLVISDDGIPAAATPPTEDFDLRVMRYRAETLGGQIATQPGETQGSSLVCRVPIELAAPPMHVEQI